MEDDNIKVEHKSNVTDKTGDASDHSKDKLFTDSEKSATGADTDTCDDELTESGFTPPLYKKTRKMMAVKKRNESFKGASKPNKEKSTCMVKCWCS